MSTRAMSGGDAGSQEGDVEHCGKRGEV
jgi:hypothetical protein